MSRLCLTLCRSTLASNLKDLETNSPDLAELRIDLLDPGEREGIASFPSRAGLPLILTCRKSSDGGSWSGKDEEREALLLASMEGDFAFIDLEEDEASELLPRRARERGIGIIRSFHDFEALPADLYERLESLRAGADIVKAAVMPRSIRDLHSLFRTGRRWKEAHGADSLILLGMGEMGVPSRILAHQMGSCLSFCSPGTAQAAPGHMSWETLHDLYRVQDIDDQTLLYGIIGNPVLHTRSPLIHNPGFGALGLNAVYVPFSCDDVGAFFDLAAALDIRGFSVTVPHKMGVRDFLDREDRAVKAIASCNTVIRRNGGWEGYNTDAEGFIRPLRETAGELKGRKAAVIGAGGAARAVVYALKREGCEVFIFNRTAERAGELAAEMGVRGEGMEDLKEALGRGESFDFLIQTSSAGMEGTDADNPVPFYRFTGDELVYDIIYAPPVTPLMQKAAAAGARVLGGMPMLLEQGRVQFRLFTGKELP